MNIKYCKWLLVFLWTWNGTLLADTVGHPLKPLSAMYQVDLRTQPIQHVTFPVIGGEDLTITVMSGDNLTLKLRLPDGTLIDQTNAGAHNIHFEKVYPKNFMERALISPVDSQIFVIEQPTAGQYELRIDGTAAVKATEIAVRVMTTGTPIRTGLAVSKTSVTPGERISLTLLLFEQSQPITNAVIEGKITDVNQVEIAPLTFADDGQGADNQAGDGAYSVSYEVPQQGGSYFIAINIAGTTSSGQPFEATEGGNIIVKPPNIKLTGVYQEQAVDEDNDGYIDYIRFEFEYTGPRSTETYYVDLTLKAENGGEVSVNSRAIPDSTQPLAVKFPAEELKKLQMDGPYQLSRVEVSTDSYPFLGHWDNLGQTAAYRLADLERRNTLLLPLRSDRGVDVDGDGLFDWLEVVFGVDVLISGNYGISANLKKENVGTTGFAFTGIDTYLSRGENEVTIAFSGEEIGRFGQDGPYKVWSVLVYPRFERKHCSAVADDFAVTQFYTCSQFSSCVRDVNILFQRLLSQLETVAINKGLKNSLRVKLKGAQVALDKNKKEEIKKNALMKLRAFTHEVRTQREKAISAAEADMLIKGGNAILDMLEQE